MYGPQSDAGAGSSTRAQTNGKAALRRYPSECKSTSGKERDLRPGPSRSSSAAHDSLRRSSSTGLDMQSLNSVLPFSNNTSLKSLINKHTFASFSAEEQQALIRLLPQCDQVIGPDNVLRMSQTALNNEFFSKSVSEWNDKASEGEFTLEKVSSGTSSRPGAVVGASGDSEKDQARCESLRSNSSSVLSNGSGGNVGANNGNWTELCRAFRERHPRDIPKAGPPFIPAPKVACGRARNKKPQAAPSAAAVPSVSCAAADDHLAAKQSGGSITPEHAGAAPIADIPASLPAATAVSSRVTAIGAVTAASKPTRRRQPLARMGRRSRVSLAEEASLLRLEADKDAVGTSMAADEQTAAARGSTATCNGFETLHAAAAQPRDSMADFAASCLLANAAQKAKNSGTELCATSVGGSPPSQPVLQQAPNVAAAGQSSVALSKAAALAEFCKRPLVAGWEEDPGAAADSKKAKQCLDTIAAPIEACGSAASAGHALERTSAERLTEPVGTVSGSPVASCPEGGSAGAQLESLGGGCSSVLQSVGAGGGCATAEEPPQGQAKTLAQIKALTKAKQMLKTAAHAAPAAAAAAASGILTPTAGHVSAAACLATTAEMVAASCSGSPPVERAQRPKTAGACGTLSSQACSTTDSGVNLQRSLAICQASSSSPLAINYMRSYEICKEVLQRSNNSGMMSLLCKQQPPASGIPSPGQAAEGALRPAASAEVTEPTAEVAGPLLAAARTSTSEMPANADAAACSAAAHAVASEPLPTCPQSPARKPAELCETEPSSQLQPATAPADALGAGNGVQDSVAWSADTCWAGNAGVAGPSGQTLQRSNGTEAAATSAAESSASGSTWGDGGLEQFTAADRARVVAYLKGRWADKNLDQLQMTTLPGGRGLFNRLRRKPIITSHPFLSMSDKDYSYSIKAHKKKLALRPQKKHKVKGKKAQTSRSADSTTAAAALDDVTSQSGSSHQSDLVAHEDVKDRVSTVLQANQTPEAAVLHASSGVRVEISAPSLASDGEAMEEEEEGVSSHVASAGKGLLDGAHLESACKNQGSCMQRSPMETSMHTVACTGAGSMGLAVEATARGTGLPVSHACSCKLKAMRECQKCGAYWHEDCVGSSEICIRCQVSI